MCLSVVTPTPTRKCKQACEIYKQVTCNGSEQTICDCDSISASPIHDAQTCGRCLCDAVLGTHGRVGTAGLSAPRRAVVSHVPHDKWYPSPSLCRQIYWGRSIEGFQAINLHNGRVAFLWRGSWEAPQILCDVFVSCKIKNLKVSVQ